MNLYTEKIMKLNKQTWNALKIYGSEKKRDFLISYLEDMVVGCENTSKDSILYFNEVDINKIDNFLHEINLVENWSWSKVKERNWNQACSDFFKPIIINNKIQVLPYWEKEDKKFINIKINPALAFGTGHHETTYMMIQAMLDIKFGNKTVFDIGTGSGILSIIAKKLNSKKVTAVDNDSLTVNNFFENLNLNQINENDVDFSIKDCLKINDFNYDIILANINTAVLLKLIPQISCRSSIMVVSGILNTDEKAIIQVIENSDKKILKKYAKNEWLCFVLEL